MKCSWAFKGLISTAALLLPLMAVPESRIQTGAASAALSATAHVNFKIIIPTVLSLQVGSGSDRAAGAETVAIMSNGRNVWLNATVRTAGDENSGTTSRLVAAPANQLQPSVQPLGGSVLFSASGRKTIAQQAQCAPGNAHAAAAPTDARGRVNLNTQQLVCTVSMP